MNKSLRNIKKAIMILTALLIGAMLAACTVSPTVTSSQPNQRETAADSTETETLPDEALETPAGTEGIAHSYQAADTRIIRDDGQVIYDAAEYHKDDDAFGIGHLADGGDALYFTEYGSKAGGGEELDENADHAIVRIDYSGQNRQVLVSQDGPNGYSDLTSFGDRLFFINDGFDSCTPGDVSKDGKEFNVVDWEAYAARFDAPPYFLSALFTKDSDYLYVRLSTFEGELEGVTREVRIDKNMKLEDMPLSEDQYLVSGSKIVLLSKDTGEKSVVYDAADFYDNGATINYLIKTDDKLIFDEAALSQDISVHQNSIITLNKQGQNRDVLCSAPDDCWYTEIELFNDRVFFVEMNLNSARVGYIAQTGGEVAYVDFPPEYQNDDVDWLEATANALEVHLVDRSGDAPQRYTLVIDADLNLSVKKS